MANLENKKEEVKEDNKIVVSNDFITSLMTSNDYKKRMLYEQMELAGRVSKLGAWLDKFKRQELGYTPELNYETKYEQFIYMNLYLNSLTNQLKTLGVNLKDELDKYNNAIEENKENSWQNPLMYVIMIYIRGYFYD